jgi:acetylornithine deacetylase/succinyl-diaminopimelate desuccinylase-like protein
MDDSAALALLEGLLDSPTPSAPAYLAGEMERLGFRVSLDDGAVVGEIGPPDRPRIVLAGTADAKAPLAALLAAATSCSTAHVVVCAAADEEELPRPSAPAAVLVGKATGWCNVAIVGEPDRDNPVVRALTSAIRRHGGRPRVDRDAAAPSAGPAPVAAYGPADSDTYLPAVAVLADALKSLLDSAEASTPDDDAAVTDRLRALGYID